jgi:hypothetical protein
MFGKTFRTGGLRVDMVSIIADHRRRIDRFLESTIAVQEEVYFKVTSVSQSASRLLSSRRSPNLYL